ncbi:MAG: metalloprotease family protein [Clostridium sp.]|uniref:metalloprotease family protein n=1 Tax=Clostridium sp. TaxID=1506 RepID=UPI0025DA8E92|nr:metalloprotease family protein [Clostridium sp.]MCI6692483.1 metalloprotease family protein [Clostridium sp.]MDY2631914.1 metalloprotease family protein [Clostridium sp.]MDY4253915.1 metalloprotease family protein [Clostridium sp.]
MNIENILLKTLIDLSWFIGIIVISGLILGFLRNTSMTNYQKKFGRQAIYITGLVGVPIHELSHLIVALLFGHKIKEVKFFQVNDENRTLGYVNHSYNPRNIYHQVGNFFIGVAPIICGSLLILLLLKIFVPASFENTNYILNTNGIFKFLKAIFSLNNFKRPEFYLFLYIVFSICSHISLSKADIKGAFIGVIFISIILLFFNIINFDLLSHINIIKYNLLLTNVLIISVIFSSLNLLISFILSRF